MGIKSGKTKEFCLLRINGAAPVYGDFIFGKNRFWGCPKIKASEGSHFGVFPKNIKFGIFAKNRSSFLAFSSSCIFLGKKRWNFMRKKNFKGAKVSKRVVAKCEGVCRTYDAIQYAYANLLSETEEIKSFQVNVLLQGLVEGEYTSDFVITKADGNLMVRECVSRKYLTKPMTTKLLDASRNYWKSHGVSDWGIVIEEVWI